MNHSLIKRIYMEIVKKSPSRQTLELIKQMAGGNVAFLLGKPGHAKTSIFKWIMKHSHGLISHVIDVRLAQAAPEEVGGIPYPDSSNRYYKLLMPGWAFEAIEEAKKNPEVGVIVVFDELNRAPQPVLNAALKILLERLVGNNEELPSNIFLVATGNQGNRDSTNVEEITDAAIATRLSFIDWELHVADWLSWAKADKVIPQIVEFFETKVGAPVWDEPTTVNGAGKPYGNPRTWVKLSNAYKDFLGEKPSTKQVLAHFDASGVASIVGQTAAVAFLSWLEAKQAFTFSDILADGVTDQVKAVFRKDPSNIARIVQEAILVHPAVVAMPRSEGNEKVSNFLAFFNMLNDELKTLIVASYMYLPMSNFKEAGKLRDSYLKNGGLTESDLQSKKTDSEKATHIANARCLAAIPNDTWDELLRMESANGIISPKNEYPLRRELDKNSAWTTLQAQLVKNMSQSK